MPVTGGTADPDGARYYLHSGNNDDTTFATYWRQSLTTAPTVTVKSPVLSGTNGAQARTAFPTATPSKLTSSDGTTMVIKGDGTATLGPTKFGAGNAAISGMDWGHHTGSTNGSGEITIGHDLGVTPTYVQVTNGTGNNNGVACTARSSTNITVTWYAADGSTLGSGVTRETDWEVRI